MVGNSLFKKNKLIDFAREERVRREEGGASDRELIDYVLSQKHVCGRMLVKEKVDECSTIFRLKLNGKWWVYGEEW